MALRTIDIGQIEDAFQYDDALTYSDGIPVGLRVKQVPTNSEHVVRLADLGGASDPLSDEPVLMAAATGTDFANKRTIAVGVGLTKTDAGAGSTLTLAVKQQSAVTSLTDNTGGTANNTLENVPTVGVDVVIAASQVDVNTAIAAIENNFADLSAKVNSILTALRSAEIIVT